MESKQKVGDVPEVANGKFCIDFFAPSDDQTINYNIDKAFGLVKADNSVLKFRLILTGTWEKDSVKLKLKNKFVYLSDEAMTCHIQMYHNYEGGELIGEKTTKDCMSMEGDKVFEVEKRCNYFGYRFVIRIGQDLDTQAQSKMNPNYANKYKDLSSSDFLVKCEDSMFPVHQWILEDRSEYFASIMRNECRENEIKELRIEDFKPNIVDMLLRYIYNGTLNLPAYGLDDEPMLQDVSDLMQIADKYVLRELADACDSYLAQWYACKLKFFATEDRDFMNYYLRFGVKTADKLQAKKWAAAIFQWILNERSIDYEELWSSLLYEFPNFAILAANLAVKKNYQDWVRQHETWSFDTLECIPTDWNWSTAGWWLKRSGNSIAIITGKFGEMKGAVQC